MEKRDEEIDPRMRKKYEENNPQMTQINTDKTQKSRFIKI